MIPTLFFLLLGANLPKGQYSLTPVSKPHSSEGVTISANVSLEHAPAHSPRLRILLQLGYAGVQQPHEPLAHALNKFALEGPFVRIDGGHWAACKGKTGLLEYLDYEADDTIKVEWRCRIESRPLEQLELRLMTTLLGTESNVELEYEGLSEIPSAD